MSVSKYRVVKLRARLVQEEIVVKHLNLTWITFSTSIVSDNI